MKTVFLLLLCAFTMLTRLPAAHSPEFIITGRPPAQSRNPESIMTDTLPAQSHNPENIMTDTAPRANDDDLLRAITANLHLELGPAAQGLLVQSRQGIVTLSGRVDNVLARDQAVRSARNTRGALQVIDRIQVQGPAPQENARRQSVQRTLPGVPAR